MTVDQPPPAEGEAADKNVVDKPVSEPESPEEDKPMPIDHFGMYKVQDEKGRHLVGYVFPNLIDVDGTSLPIALFTNGSHYAVQSDIAGVHRGATEVASSRGLRREWGAFTMRSRTARRRPPSR